MTQGLWGDNMFCMNTRRVMGEQVMDADEKWAFVKIVRGLPWLYEPISSEIDKHAKSANTLLDVGCGDGYLLELVHERHPHLELSGIDIDPAMIRLAAQKLDYNFMEGDAEELAYSADIVTSNLSLHHFENPLTAINKMIDNSNAITMISDQLRPDTGSELETRLARRSVLIGNKDVPFYAENERASILEAYSKAEIIKLASELSHAHELLVFDNDYYERFVLVIKQ